MAASTALKAFHSLRLKTGESLFIAGASGAIGTFAIQLAVRLGCVVAGSASAKNHQYMRSLGAAKTVDYREPNWADEMRTWMPAGVDAGLAVQPGTTGPSLPVIRENGRIVAVSGDQPESERGIQIYQVSHQIAVEEELKKLMELIANREIALEIEQVYSFQDAIEALQKVRTRHARGKVVIEV